MRTANPVRKEYANAGNHHRLRSYTTTAVGAPLTPGTIADKITIKEEFGEWRVRTIDPAANCVVISPAGGDPLSPVNGWTPAIDGDNGYNVAVNFRGNNLVFLEGGPAEKSLEGPYRIIVEFGDVTQEFEVSVAA